MRTDALDADVAASGVTKQMEKDLQAGLFHKKTCGICADGEKPAGRTFSLEKTFCGICAINEFCIEKKK